MSRYILIPFFPGIPISVPLISDLRLSDSGKLAFPPCQCGFGGYTTSLCEPEQMDGMRGPAAILDEMGQDSRESVESWCRVGTLDEVTEWIEGGVPLIRLFVQERYSVGVSATLGRPASTYALFWGTNGKGGGLW